MDEKVIESDKKYRGVIAKYVQDKGFGFIKSETVEKDLFFHFNDVIKEKDKEKIIFEGQEVEFKLYSDKTKAYDIKILEDKSSNNYYRSAKLHKDAGNYYTAKIIFEEGIKKSSSPPLFDQYALMEKDRENYQEAEKIFRKGLEIYPNANSILLNLSLLLWERGRLDEAYHYMYELSKIKKNDGKLFFLMGYLSRLRGATYFKASKEYYTKALELNPNNTKCKVHLNILEYLMMEDNIVKKTMLIFKKCNLEAEWLWEKKTQFVDIELTTKNEVLKSSFEMEDRILTRIVMDESNVTDIVNDIKSTLQKPISGPFRKINTNLAFLICEDKDKIKEIILDMQTLGLSIIPITKKELDTFQEDKEYQYMLTYISKYLTQKDLYDVRTPISDTRTFFGREEIIMEITRKINTNNHVGIFGLRKIGKTSLHNKLIDNFPNDLVAKIDAQYLTSKDCKELVIDIIYNLIKDCRKKYPEKDVFTLMELSKFNPPELSISRAMNLFKRDIEVLLELFSNSKILIFIDEADLLANEMGEGFGGSLEFFRTLRGISQTTNRVFSIISGPAPTMCNVSTWGGSDNPIFQMYIEIYVGNFPRNECDEMVITLGKKMALNYTQEALDLIYDYTGGHPYITRQLCSSLIVDFKERPLDIDKEMVENAVKTFLKKKGPILNEITERIGDISLQILKIISDNYNQADEEIIIQEIGHNKIMSNLNNLENYNIIEDNNGKYSISIKLLDRWVKSNWAGN